MYVLQLVVLQHNQLLGTNQTWLKRTNKSDLITNLAGIFQIPKNNF